MARKDELERGDSISYDVEAPEVEAPEAPETPEVEAPEVEAPEVEPITDEQLVIAQAIADLDEDQREQLVEALEKIAAVQEPPSRDGLKAGDYAELKGHAYVRFPDGTVVTASRQLLVGQPGEYFVSYWGEDQGEETFTVAEKAKA